MERELQLEVGEGEAGHRVDVAVSTLAGVSRSRVQKWIDEGRVLLEGEVVSRASRGVELGERLSVRVPEAVEAEAKPQAIPIDRLFEDDEIVVVDKPAGLVVHPAPGHPDGTLVNALLHHCGGLAGVGGVARPGIVHRLDKGTSGVMVAAKTDRAHHSLAEQFHDHTIDREYRALVRGIPRAEEFRVDEPVGRHPRDRKRMSTRAKIGREAHTAFRIHRRFVRNERSWLVVLPETGRTHQIRVHLASIGLPIAGDPVYGGRASSPRPGRGPAAALERALTRPALHAARLGFDHPVSGERMRFHTPVPNDLRELLEALAAEDEA